MFSSSWCFNVCFIPYLLGSGNVFNVLCPGSCLDLFSPVVSYCHEYEIHSQPLSCAVAQCKNKCSRSRAMAGEGNIWYLPCLGTVVSHFPNSFNYLFEWGLGKDCTLCSSRNGFEYQPCIRAMGHVGKCVRVGKFKRTKLQSLGGLFKVSRI